MKRILLFISLLLVATGIVSPDTYCQQNDMQKAGDYDTKSITAIRAVLDAQTAAWNRGDIEGFMEGYWRSSETVFISGDTMTRGWQTVLDRYKKGYAMRERMGTLTFSDLEFKAISKDAVVVIGRWKLTLVGETPHGRFTLIFRKTSQGWRIVHDHTSSA